MKGCQLKSKDGEASPHEGQSEEHSKWKDSNTKS